MCLTHCSSDDNGGSTSSGSPDPPTTEPGPPTTEPGPPPIYLWITGCEAQGDMTGGDCGNIIKGRAGANSICENRYATDVTDTSVIDGEIDSPSHKALIADSSHPEADTGIPNRETRAIQRPNGTVITDSWAKFFDLSEIMDEYIDDNSRTYWTGLAPALTIGLHCSGWMTISSGSIGNVGTQPKKDQERLGIILTTNCGHVRRLLCITY